MAELVALALPGGTRFVTALERVWAAGDAAFPLDLRLPAAAQRAVLAAMAPARLVDADGDEHALDGGRPVDGGDALVVATSGSTGTPKGVVLTHAAVAGLGARHQPPPWRRPSRDRWLACLPLAHVGGLAVVTRALVTGTPLTVLPGFDAAGGARPAGATLVSLVPTALARLDPARSGSSCSAVRRRPRTCQPTP